MYLKNLISILFLFLYCGELIPQNIFQLQNPVIRPEPVFTIKSLNGNLYFGGGYGLLLKSINSGSNWTEINLNTVSDLREIISIGLNRGLILTKDSCLFKSTNSGQNWVKVASFNFNITDIASAGVNSVFLSTSEFVGKSSDGGISWTYFNPEPSAVNNYYEFCFYDSTLGYLSAVNTITDYTLVFKTLNAGLNWNRINTSIDNFIVQKIFFVNQSTGWAAGKRFGNLYITKTTNGGNNWSEQYASQTEANVNGMYFQNSNNGYIATNLKIFRTTNGGLNWQDYISGYGMTASYFANDTMIMYSDKSGRVIRVYGSGLPDTLLGKNSYRLDKINIASVNNIWINGPGYRNFKSSDGGAYWYHDVNSSISQIKRTFFADESTGYSIAGRGKIMKTTNFGTNWQSLFDTSAELSNIFILNQGTGWVTGNGILMKTTDGGLNWLRYGVNNEIQKIWFADSFTGYALLNDTIRKSTNGGAIWQNQNNIHIKDFCFINPNTGWSLNYADSLSEIYKTTNGGINYTLCSRVTATKYKIQFLDSQTGYITDGNSVNRTTDGGQIWKSVNYPISDYLNIHDFYFLNTGTGWFCGDNSLVLNTKTGNSISIKNLYYQNRIADILTYNFPNPFNGQTRILYNLPSSGKIIIKIFNISGQEVYKYESEFENRGKHEITFDGSHLSSGIYFILLTNNIHSVTGKMMLIK